MNNEQIADVLEAFNRWREDAPGCSYPGSDATTEAISAAIARLRAPAALPEGEPLAYVRLGGISSSSAGLELDDCDIEPNMKAIEALQQRLVTGDSNQDGLTISLFAAPSGVSAPAAPTEAAAAQASAKRGQELIEQARSHIRSYVAGQRVDLENVDKTLSCASAVLTLTTTTALDNMLAAAPAANAQPSELPKRPPLPSHSEPCSLDFVQWALDMEMIAARLLAAHAQSDSAGDARDAARLDWLDRQAEAYGFQETHEGNKWGIGGAFRTVREAIDAAIAASEATKGEQQ